MAGLSRRLTAHVVRVNSIVTGLIALILCIATTALATSAFVVPIEGSAPVALPEHESVQLVVEVDQSADDGAPGRRYDDRSNFARASARPGQYRSAPQASGSAFHHTTDQAVSSIMRSGLRPGSYATPTRGLSPLQAHIELALNPAGGARNAVLRIDVAGLRAAGYEIPAVTRVTGANGMAGGGWEMRFPYEIPTEFLKVIR